VPELPDIVVYIEALERRVLGAEISGIRVASPAVLRTYDPPYETVIGRRVESIDRVGKRIVFNLDPPLFLVIHLMIAGRLKWEPPRKAIPKKVGLAALDFQAGSLVLTEQGTHKRAGIWVMSRRDDVATLDRGGVEPLQVTPEEFEQALRAENRTLKRALTDPRIFSGIGNAYSDEILWEARMSPVRRTSQLTGAEITRLREAIVDSLTQWSTRLREEVGEGWPTKVTAFRPEMAVHGKYGEPCPRCGSPVQRIVYASNETNYCARCQTGGRLLADRSLSRLLKEDWPRTLEELEET
jgi:formamidopyrimidine-DNA glycosylase